MEEISLTTINETKEKVLQQILGKGKKEKKRGGLSKETVHSETTKQKTT